MYKIKRKCVNDVWSVAAAPVDTSYHSMREGGSFEENRQRFSGYKTEKWEGEKKKKSNDEARTKKK